MDYRIRRVKKEDLDQIAKVEAECFPEAEAADRETFLERIEAFPESFFVACLEDGRIIGFINGCVTNEKTIRDEMFEHPGLHEPQGAWQSVFGLDVAGDWRRHGVAAALMEHLIKEARENGRNGMILTCKDRLIAYYEKFGYLSQGISKSVHGGAVWYDMVLEF